VSGIRYPWVDIGIAGEHLVLAATELGLGTCWIGWIRPRVIRRIVGWPLRVRPASVIAVGHPRQDAQPTPPSLRRKPLDEIVRWVG
jgi:nitroreductase